MAKRKSFDEKNKGIHKSRKLIIDTVFGREDNTQKVHGYEGEGYIKRNVGERWIDSDGKEWEQKEGYRINISKLDDVRAYLDKLNTCSSEECKTIKYDHLDKKTIRKTGLCLNCLQKLEFTLKADGTFPYYEDYKISCNQLSYIKDMKMKFEEALVNVKTTFEIINEDGSTEKWNHEVDIDKLREDIQKDIDGATEAIEALLERKAALENKLREFNHPELIKN